MKHDKAPHAISLALLLGASVPLTTGCERADASIKLKNTPPISVTTASVTLVETPVRLRLTGNLRGEKETDLAANVAGRLLKTNVERGQSVNEGDLLAQVDTQSARLALQEAKVSVATSETQDKINQAECARYEKLKNAGVVTDLEYDQVTAKCKTAPLNLKAARARQSIYAKNVGDGLIRAPFSGVVTERYVEVGEYVQPSSRVVSLSQVDTLRVVFSVPEKHYPDIKQGAEVLVSVGAYQNQAFSGKVVHISGAVSDTRDIVVEASLPNPDHKLLPGMFAEVELTIGSKKLPSIPKASVFEQNGKSNVFVAVGKQLEQRVISIASEIGDRLVVQRGLEEGDQVASVLTPELKNGAHIK